MSIALNLTRVQSLMQDLGPSVPEIDILLQEDDSHWLLQSQDGLQIEIAHCENPSRLLLSAAIGSPETEQIGDMYITMLCTNLLFAEQHALRVALTHPGGDFLLISELVLDDYSLGSLSKMLTEYMQQARYFCELISSSDQLEKNDLPLLQVAGRV